MCIMKDDNFFMNKAILMAKLAYSNGDVPVGCVIVRNNKIIASSYNRKEIDGIATSHAEVIAINKACRKLGTWHLEDCILYTTMEPCMMCTGAIIQSRISCVVYGIDNSSFGYLNKVCGKGIKIRKNVLSDDSFLLVNSFFKDKRISKNN